MPSPRLAIEIVATVALLAVAGYRIVGATLVAPWALAISCAAFVAVMWGEAWRLRATPRARRRGRLCLAFEL